MREKLLVAKVMAALTFKANVLVQMRGPATFNDLKEYCHSLEMLQRASCVFYLKPDKQTSQGTKKLQNCFICGKLGHVASQCRNKQNVQGESSSNSVVDNVSRRDVKPIICFNCGDVVHKSTDCPKKGKKSRSDNRLKTGRTRIKMLDHNELIATLDGVSFPVTLNTGGSVSLVPKELVPKFALRGETIETKGVGRSYMKTEEAFVELHIGQHLLKRKLDSSQALSWIGQD